MTLEELNNNFRAGGANNPDYIFEQYNNHSIFLKNISHLDTEEDIENYCEIIWRQLDALVFKGYFNDSIDIAIPAIDLADKSYKRIQQQPSNSGWFYGLKFQYAVAYYNLEDYKIATKMFSELKKSIPNNDNVKKWFELSRAWQQYKYIKFVYFFAIISMVSAIVFRDNLSRTSENLIWGLTLFCYLFALSWEQYNKRSRRRKS